ncbi:3562_t:CDS:1, partial [Funneliformis mosseae]
LREEDRIIKKPHRYLRTMDTQTQKDDPFTFSVSLVNLLLGQL